MLNISDSGIYQCAAENKYQTIYANAELRVLGESFIYNQKSFEISLLQDLNLIFSCELEITFL